ncbi:hypothetical protein D3C72_2114020 [compost metagenome]
MQPSSSSCGTVWSMKRWRSSSLLWRLIFQAMDWALLGESASLGPNIIRDGHQRRLMASWTMSFWAWVPWRIMVRRIS